MAFCLLVISGPMEGVSFVIKGATPVTLGRGRHNDFVISGDPWVSTSHAHMYELNGELCLVDLGSSNGTFVAGQKIQPRQTVVVKDFLVLGSTVLKLEDVHHAYFREPLSLNAPDSGQLLAHPLLQMGLRTARNYKSTVVGLIHFFLAALEEYPSDLHPFLVTAGVDTHRVRQQLASLRVFQAPYQWLNTYLLYQYQMRQGEFLISPAAIEVLRRFGSNSGGRALLKLLFEGDYNLLFPVLGIQQDFAEPELISGPMIQGTAQMSIPALPSAAPPSAALPSAAPPSAALPSAALPSAAPPSAAPPGLTSARDEHVGHPTRPHASVSASELPFPPLPESAKLPHYQDPLPSGKVQTLELDFSGGHKFALRTERRLQHFARTRLGAGILYSDGSTSLVTPTGMAPEQKERELEEQLEAMLVAYEQSFTEWFNRFLERLSPQDLAKAPGARDNPNRLWEEFLYRFDMIDLDSERDRLFEIAGRIFKARLTKGTGSP